jgi:hypothetical protein
VGAVGAVGATAHSAERLHRVVTWDYGADSALRFHVQVRRVPRASLRRD